MAWMLYSELYEFYVEGAFNNLNSDAEARSLVHTNIIFLTEPLTCCWSRAVTRFLVLTNDYQSCNNDSVHFPG